MEAQEGTFLANMTHPGYFNLVREKFDLLADDREKEAYRLNWNRGPLKLRDLRGLFLMAGAGECTHMTLQALRPLRLPPS